jgi:hypothetical protein
MRPEDVVQLYHYAPAGIVAFRESMTYLGIKVTTMWKIKVKQSGLHLCSEEMSDYLERTEECLENDQKDTTDSPISRT